MYLMEKANVQVWLEHLGVIGQGGEKSVAGEESRPNYEGPHLKVGFILKLIESHSRDLIRGTLGSLLCFR